MNKLFVSLSLLFVIASISCQITGGWKDLNPASLTNDAKDALNIAVANVQKSLSNLNGVANFMSVDNAQSQVVAGIKYKFQLSFSLLVEGDELFLKRYEVIIWQQPAGYNGPNVNYVILSVQDLSNDDSNTLNLAIAGGWSNLDSNSLDEWAQRAFLAAVQGVQSLNNAVFVKLETIQSQIVAGVNYKLVITFDIGKYEVVVWKKLDGSLQVTRTTQLNRRLGQPGGWTNLDVKNLDDWTKSAANAAVGSVKGLLKKSFGSFVEVLVAQSQIVAGTNYKLHLAFTTTDGGSVHFEAIVWRQLSGTYQVTSIQQAN